MLILTDRLTSLMETLTQRVRFLSTAQIAEAWWSDTPTAHRTAERYLIRLQKAGYLTRATIIAHPVLPLQAPMLAWTPQDPTPDFDLLAYRCRARWKNELTSITVWTATAWAATSFSGFGGIRNPNQLTHDLHVGTLFTRLYRDRPEMAARWVSEERLMQAGLGDRIPDAIVYDDKATPVFALDFGGFGSRERLARLHRACDRWQLPYSVW